MSLRNEAWKWGGLSSHSGKLLHQLHNPGPVFPGLAHGLGLELAKLKAEALLGLLRDHEALHCSCQLRPRSLLSLEALPQLPLQFPVPPPQRRLSFRLLRGRGNGNAWRHFIKLYWCVVWFVSLCYESMKEKWYVHVVYIGMKLRCLGSMYLLLQLWGS